MMSLLIKVRGFSGRGRGQKPQGGWSQFTEWLPGSVGRHPEVPQSRRVEYSNETTGDRVSTGGEGFGPPAELAHLGGEKGQESIGSDEHLIAHTRVRTLGRSNALKSQEGERELAHRNGKRATDVERRCGWSDGKGSGDREQTPWADVARNRATGSGWDQTVERVRNSENGRCRGGKPTQRSPELKRRRGPNPKGEVVRAQREPESSVTLLAWSSNRTDRDGVDD
jgi:hypothetical protein